MKWIWTYPAVYVHGTTGWELLLGKVACKSRGKTKTKLRGLSPRVNYTDRAATAGRQT